VINAVGTPQSLLLLGGTSDIALAIARRYAAEHSLRVVLAARPGERRTAAAEELRGKKGTFNIRASQVAEKVLPALDDDFAKTVGDVDTLGELRSKLREELHQTRTAEARREALAQIIAKMAESATIDLPEPMIDRAVEDDLRRLRGRLAQQGVPLEAYLRAVDQTEDALREEMRPAARERFRKRGCATP
jgi:trigger factor